jgi:hypothetical protein
VYHLSSRVPPWSHGAIPDMRTKTPGKTRRNVQSIGLAVVSVKPGSGCIAVPVLASTLTICRLPLS